MADSPFREVAHEWLSLGLPPQPGVVTEVALSADGSLVAASVLTPDPAADQDRISTWIRPTDEAGTWTGLHTGCTALSFSPGPDRPRLLGLAAADQGKLCVVIDPETDTVLRATAPMLSGGKPVWRPDGEEFAWSCAALPEAPPTLHRSRRLGFDRDGRGWLADDVRRVHVFALGDDKPVIVESATDCRELSWSAEGLLYVADRHDDRYRDLGAQLFRFDPDTGHEVALTEPDLVPAASTRLPDGTVAFVALTEAAGCGSVGAVHTTEGRLTDPASVDVAHPLTSRVHGLSVVGELLLTAQLARGAVPLLLLDPARPGRQRRLLDGPCEVDAYDAGHGGIVALVRQGASTEDVFFLPRAALPEPVEPALPVREPVSLGERGGVRPLTVNGVDAWLVPPADGSASPAPLVVWLHGGPGAQAGWVIPPDVQRLAARGYAGLYLNPRGSAGRGAEFTASLLGAPGVLDLEDVRAVLDAVVAMPGIDGDRVGVHGVSYGGYLAALLWSATPLIKAAVVERAIIGWDFHRTGSDLGIQVTDGYWKGGPGPGERPDPLTVPLDNDSPVLVLAAERDLRCPPAESRLLFARLVEAGVPAEFAVLARCGHGVGAAPPTVRQARAAALLDWWQSHLPVRSSTP